MNFLRITKTAKIILVVLCISVAACVQSEERMQFYGERVSFVVPEGATMWYQIPVFDKPQDQQEFLNGKLILRVPYQDEFDLRAAHPISLSSNLRELLDQNDDINRHDLVSLFDRENEFVLTRFSPMSMVQESYRRLIYCGDISGEQYFASPSDGLLAPGLYGYCARLVVEDGIVTIVYQYYDIDSNLSSTMEEFFVMRDGQLYWKDRTSPSQLFKSLENEKTLTELPDMLVRLHDGWNLIIDTVKVSCSD